MLTIYEYRPQEGTYVPSGSIVKVEYFDERCAWCFSDTVNGWYIFPIPISILPFILAKNI